MKNLKLAIAWMIVERWEERSLPVPERLDRVADRLRKHADKYEARAKKNQEPYEKAKKAHADATRMERSLKRQRSAVKKYGTKKAVKAILADIDAAKEKVRKTGDTLVKKFSASEYKNKKGERSFVGHSTKMMDKYYDDKKPADRWRQHVYRLQSRSELEKPRPANGNPYFRMSDEERQERIDDLKKRPPKSLKFLGANKDKKKRESWEE